VNKFRKVKDPVCLLMKLHLTGTECCHIGSYSVSCHPTQVNTPALTPATGRYSIYLPRRDGRLSWPRWPVTYRDGFFFFSRLSSRWRWGWWY